MEETRTLDVGQETTLRRGFFTTHRMVYAGMPSDEVYSLAVMWTAGHTGVAYNVFVRTGQTQVELAKGRLTVFAVSPQQIRFRYER